MRFHFTRHDALAVRTKSPIPAFAVKLIESHSQSLPTLPVATLPEEETMILDVPVILQFVIVNRFDLTGIQLPKSISVSVRVNHSAFIVVQVRERLVHRVISSITQVPAVHLHISLFVAIDVVIVLSEDRSPHPDIGQTTHIERVVGVISASVIALLNSESVQVMPTIVVWSPVFVPDRLDPVTVPVAATLVGVIASSVRVIAGVVVGFATDPDTQLAVVTETDVTVQDPHQPHVCITCLFIQGIFLVYEN